MNKSEFIDKLKDKLKILNNDEVEDIINEYSEHIDEKIKSGTSERDAINEFGDINELVEGILDAYKINKDYNKGQSTFIDDIAFTSKEVFNKSIKIFSNGTFKDIIQFLIYILIALMICAVVKIPFYFVQDCFENIISPIPYKFYNVISTVVEVVINLIYIVVAYIVFIKLMNERILNGFKLTNEPKKSKTKVKESKKVEKESLCKNDNSFINYISKIILYFFKLIAFFILVIMACGLVTSSVVFAFSVEFSIKYYLFLGIIVASLGLVVGFIWICDLLYRFIFSLKFNTTRLLITFISSIVLFGSGLGIFMIEVTTLKFKDAEVEYTLRKDYQLDVSDVRKISCDNCNKVDKKINDTMEDNTINIKVYGPDYSNPYYTKNEGLSGTIIKVHYLNSTNKFINKVLTDVKNKEFYNYDDIVNLKMEIEGNKNTLKKLEITECTWCD